MTNQTQAFHVGYLLEDENYRKKYLAATNVQFMSDPELVAIVQKLKAGNFTFQGLMKTHGQKILLRAIECANLAAKYQVMQRWEKEAKRSCEQ